MQALLNSVLVNIPCKCLDVFVLHYRNVIDVAALGSHALEQHDYLERVKHYSQRLQLAGQWGGSLNHHICVLTDVPAPERWLAAEPIHPSDQSLVGDNFCNTLFYFFQLRVM